ncbi:multiple sugar transport system substrate-binding protein [Kribbella orskensis]|uniref:Multiple sugar transport system substrate-binding protein n=1 Tax=Kribbella orskensis TaxID=2512216 RepID=A0ABY2B9Q8_9ACTN|nr:MULTISPECIES: sugar ABC transporter substrate-binding protein [Kribbella]TCN30482.1 multiple sugar transport system substrate-binding protein [Kribbella sp. VKM Ac-2500]TCO11124.1 multiple sugar transport system substrate-binding protein [Kribbella orskensis]
MRSRRLTPVAALAVAALTLAGCGLGSSDDTSSGSQPTVDANAKVTGEVSFQTWALKPKFTSYVEGVIKAFEAKYPGTKVTWLDQPGDGYDKKVLSQASAGQLPDVTNLPPEFALPLAKQNLLLDVAAADPAVKTDYVDGGLTAYQYNGLNGTFGYPWYLNTDIDYWNSTKFAAAGLDAKNPPKTFDELLAAAKVVHDKSGGKEYLMSRLPGIGDFTNAGVKIVSDDGKKFTFNTPEAVALLDKYRDAYKAGYLPRDILTQEYLGNSKLFTQGKVAWTTGGGNAIVDFQKDNPSLKGKVVPSPALDTPPLYVQGLSVSSKSKNQAAAIALARFVTNAENQAAFAKIVNIFPSTKASANDPYFSKSDGTVESDAKVLAFESLAKAKSLQPAVISGATNDFINQQISLAIAGKVTSQQALDAAVAKADQLLAQ